MAVLATSSDATIWIRRWLLVLAVMVYLIVLIGGATRLTDSGLSITEWDPVTGALPPLSAEAWAAEFEKYKQTAEYRFQNAGMGFEAFRTIFLWEWGHRFVARLIGLAAVAGLLVFWLRGWLDRPLLGRLVLIVGLGALQGAVGWWMVASGLGDTTRVDVAPYRLMTHFTLALAILCLIAWTWLDLGGAGDRPATASDEHRWAWALLGLTAAQMAAGALVAGHDAGRTYTDWPLMGGQAFPDGYWEPALGLRSLVESAATVQFNHRLMAYALLAVSLAAAIRFRRSEAARMFALVAGLVALQAAWGVLTLINVAPLGLALAHQGLGVVALLAATRLAWAVSPPSLAARPAVQRL